MKRLLIILFIVILPAVVNADNIYIGQFSIGEKIDEFVYGAELIKVYYHGISKGIVLRWVSLDNIDVASGYGSAMKIKNTKKYRFYLLGRKYTIKYLGEGLVDVWKSETVI